MGDCETSGFDGQEAGAARPASSRARASKRTSRVAMAGEEPEAGDPLLEFAPYRHRAARRNSITPARQVAFVSALAASGIVTQAARVIGASLEALYRLRHQPGAEGFAAAWDAAIDRGMARLEDCALERALLGEERVIYRHGEVVARWRRYDTQLLIFLLRQRRPERFHDGRFLDRVEMLRLREAHLRQWETQDAGRDVDAIYDSITAKLDRARARDLAEKEAKREGG